MLLQTINYYGQFNKKKLYCKESLAGGGSYKSKCRNINFQMQVKFTFFLQMRLTLLIWRFFAGGITKKPKGKKEDDC
jgi:hypothetical protein